MADEKKVSGKTRAGGAAKPFPWEEAIAEQYERTKSRLKGLATEPEAELQRILEQYLPKKSDSREERMQKLEDLAMGFAGTTIGKGVLPTAAREQGLQKFLEPSAVKERLYHGTSRPDLTEFKTGKMIKEKQYPGNTIEPWAVDNRDAVFLTPSPQFSGRYSGGDWEISGGYTPTTYPVRVQVKNPWDYENPEHIESVIQAYKEKYPLRRDKSGAVPSEESLRHHWFEKNVRELPLRERDNWSGVEKADLQEIIRSLGHDAFFVKESGIKNLGVYDPRKIKSAIGNRGTYDITDPDITKAEGGLAQYGLRHSGEGVKGKGYFGAMAGRDGTVTELSAEDESGEYPLVVPTLTAEELDRLLAGGEPTPEMLDKASSWAATRRKRGQSPFASPTEVRMPRPKAEGGSVNLTDLPDEVNPSNWREHLQNNVRADARALLGVKDGGAINLDDLIEQALKKKDGGAINLDDLIDWTLAKAEHRKMKEGGAVKMQGGGNPGEVAGDMFKPKPLSIPEPITNLVEALRRQFEKEKRSMSKPGAVQDVLMRGPVAAYAGAPADILGMGGELLDYAQKKIPALRKPASVMDTGPEKTPPMGYAPVFPLSPEGSYGTTAAQELMGKAGLTTGEERPLFEMGATAAAPIAGYAGFKAGKALAPTAIEMLDVELANMMKPYQMAVAPEGKAGKVKAPANPVGFYNPAEKAALNLQRKKGTGSAFISDLKKQPGVTDERIAELGLTDLASNPNVTREEVIAAVEQNRIPLRESVRRPYDEAAEYSDTISGIEDSLIYYRGGVKDVQAELERVRKMAPNSPLVKQYEDKLAVMRDKVDELEAKLDSTKPAKFGPDVDESYSLPGGEDYREIRVRLPENKAELPNMEGFTVETLREIPRTGQRDVRIRDAQGNVVTTLYTEFGDDERILKTVAAQLNKEEKGKNNFYHQSHHDNEPNVLFHLRVANHVDEEGKRGLLIDELQSDWHQTGREKGYKGETPQISWEDPEYVAARRKASDLLNEYNSNNTNPARQKEIEPLLKAAREEERRFTDLSNAYYRAVPNAPFKDNWYQLGLKRAIKEAVDTGMDRVYLTTGARQADRYDLSKQLSRVSYQDGVLHGYDKSGSLVVNKAMTPDELPNYVGKDLGKKMVENAQKDAEIRNKISVARYEGRPESEINALRSQLDGVKTDYAGVDLKVGGEGMKQYYDKNYKNYLEKYAKQHGGKLGMTHLKTREEWPFPITIKEEGGQFRLFGRDPRTDSFNPNLAGRSFDSYDDALKARDTLYEGFAEPVYYIDLTDAMRESAKKGQSYADGGGVFNTDPDITDAGRIIPEHTI